MAEWSTLDVQGDRVPEAVEALVTVFATRADDLSVLAADYIEGREPLTAVRDARRALADAEDALEALGWDMGIRPSTAAVAGPAPLVRDAAFTALLEAAERVPAACRAYRAGEVDLGALEAAVAAVAAWHRHFAELEPGDA
jgi:hypothetical protein